MNKVAQHIQNNLLAIGDEKKARWLENYVKHSIQSRGVGIPEIRQMVKEAEKSFHVSQKPIQEQFMILNDLIKQPYTEDKLAAILYLQLFGKKIDSEKQLNLISSWFDHYWITDWNVCDWLCVRVITPLVDIASKETIAALTKWNIHENQWKARASLVPFAQCKTMHQHIDKIYLFSVTLIKREERFCKTAVGWVLRQYSKVDPHFVTGFLNEYAEWTTKEVVNNATKYWKKT